MDNVLDEGKNSPLDCRALKAVLKSQNPSCFYLCNSIIYYSY